MIETRTYRCTNCGNTREKMRDFILVMCQCGYEMTYVPTPEEYLKKIKGGNTKKMASLKEEAQAYEPKQTLNIADLDRVDLTFPIEDRKRTNSDGDDFEYKVMIANGLEYRVPVSVLEEIKKILEIKPEVKFVHVTKTGTGMKNTKYFVSVVE